MQVHTIAVIQEYKEKSRRRFLTIAIGICICAASFIADILLGPSRLTLSETFAAIFHRKAVPVTTAVIVWTLRFPAALMALGVGAALGLAGASIQTILDNPPASPYTLGISAGAGFGAAPAIVFGVIGFIGLAGPHIARILVGEDQRFFIPLSAVFGAAVLSAASVISKLVLHGAMLPIGIVTGLSGIGYCIPVSQYAE
ncbi:MAG: iron chelate uptake ABC transporter family permease subunit, partial [Spirochaetaceae bacterium]|jgi:ABC-type Fe3+-siderophore transport system permease subunit|nr:iron chelate uptake ABC transporter family permease subunit [Spirochaetaceae bacterium]